MEGLFTTAAKMLGWDSAPVTVSVHEGSFTGRSSDGVDTFTGIPYAEPPAGLSRLQPPQPLKKRHDRDVVLPRKATGPPQRKKKTRLPPLPWLPFHTIRALLSVIAPPNPQDEDCLTVTIQRPAGIPPDAKLPVLLFFYGGAFRHGSTQTWDAALIIKRSVELGMPLVYVVANYRVGAHGFLGGKQVQEARCGNLGLKDQRLALEWAADNIAAFGGDPAKITIWGESAGAFSVFDHLIINNGDHTYNGNPLFRGAMMNSGSASRTEPVDCAKAQDNYDTIFKSLMIADETKSLAAMRALSFNTFDDAVPVVGASLSYEGLNGPYLPRPDPCDPFFDKTPEEALRTGAFARVPVLLGIQEDEGSVFVFAQRNICTTDDIVDYLQPYFPATARETIAELVGMYPDDPNAGCPYHTGLNYNAYPQQKRLASILGDYFFVMMRRIALAGFAERVPVWSFTSTYLRGTSALGTFHASDMTEIFSALPLPAAAVHPLTYLIAFVHGLDPNAASKLPHWPQWDEHGKMTAEFTATGTELKSEEMREDVYRFYASHARDFFI